MNGTVFVVLAILRSSREIIKECHKSQIGT
ncbi:hypothetical protein ZEAMMB73_Zm00001d019310 [Zea mays]|uniref:Uncharacterized protein n=1 Tax=Zea mays TaxID=4577 RepID=A0A1D6HWR5_MAIZE|nr:hypothetical protein ZEAMMB73_Zm00001d019310 [Zea mays]